MHELLPGVFRWTVVWPDWFPLESYWVRTDAGSVLVDPVESSRLHAIEDARDLRAVIITDASHERSARLFAKRTEAPIYVPADSAPNIEDLDCFHTYDDGDRLPCDLLAIGVPGSSVGEQALLSPLHGGTLFVGDALGTTAKWTPAGEALGAHPTRHRTPNQSLAHLLDHEFENLLPGHGLPILGGAKGLLADLIERAAPG